MNFRITTDAIDVTPMPSYIEVHKQTGKEIPLVHRGQYWCFDCGDWHDEYTLDKRFHPQNIVKKRTDNAWREFTPGLTHYYIDDIEVSKEQFEESYNARKP